MSTEPQSFTKPETRVKNVFDLNPWYFSKAYKEYLTFLRVLNKSVQSIKTTDDVKCTDLTLEIIDLLDALEKWIDEIPLEAVEEQRFGNKAYRKFYERLTGETESLLKKVLPERLHPAIIELSSYFTEAFGNATRIDYGSGHEANFLIFLFCLKKLELFDGEDNQALVLRIFQKYLRVCRHLQTRFKMEPAGSRGVHALDDFQFAPFIFGSSQLIGRRGLVPDSYLKQNVVEAHAHESLFLDAVKFINETKTGPFHEHSNQLWNISAVQTWNKVNEGMFKMYEGEVLKKFPVVQHMMFGSLFSFEKREDIEESETANAPESGDYVGPGMLTKAPFASGPPRQPMQHGMFAFQIPSVAKSTSVHSSNVGESGDLRRIHEEKHPEEHCPPPMQEP